MNSAVAALVEKSFKKIFKNVAEELGEQPQNVQLGIYYTEGVHKYKAYKNYTEGKEIELGNYMDVMTSAIAGGAIDSTMAQGGPRYAKELTEKLNREVSVNEVSVLMAYNPDGMPRAVLMCRDEAGADQKQRFINIETEF